jgi:EAL domain-containing protein (putative c-di-GMP-specific phosphodiesterase class I)
LAGDPDATSAILSRLNSLGVGLSIDDFGTGYSSLATLKRSPVSWLKIDRSFVAGLPKNADDIAIVQTVIGLAHSLGIRAIAEGVETDAQLALLQQAGCDAVQGYLIAEPIRPDEIPAWLARHKTAYPDTNGQSA